MQAPNLTLDRNRAEVPGNEVPRIAGLHQREAKAVRIRQRKHPLRETRFERINLDVVTDESVGPPSKAFRRNGQTHLVGQSGARTSWTHVGPREERKVGARS